MATWRGEREREREMKEEKMKYIRTMKKRVIPSDQMSAAEGS